MSELTASRLREVLSYDPDTGIFRWKIPISNRMRPNSVAGRGKLYRSISIDCRSYYAHRLAWLYMHGEWPRDEIDHINQNKTDNRICNLRQATHRENCRNIGIRRTNKCGVKGVFFRPDRGTWIAQIRDEKRSLHLGTFQTAEDASLAYQKAAAALHGEFAVGA